MVDEDTCGVGLRDGRGELAEGLAHQSSLQTYHVVTHVALDLLLWRERSHRVDNEDVDGSRTYELVSNLQCLLTIVGLRDPQVVHIHTQLGSIETVKGVLSVNERCYAALLLCLSNGMNGQCGLT